jgi:hypothetical protein
MANNDPQDPQGPSQGDKILKTVGLGLVGFLCALVVSDALNPNGLIRSGIRSLNNMVSVYNNTNRRLTILVKTPDDAPNDLFKAVVKPGQSQEVHEIPTVVQPYCWGSGMTLHRQSIG